MSILLSFRLAALDRRRDSAMPAQIFTPRLSAANGPKELVDGPNEGTVRGPKDLDRIGCAHWALFPTQRFRSIRGSWRAKSGCARSTTAPLESSFLKEGVNAASRSLWRCPHEQSNIEKTRRIVALSAVWEMVQRPHRGGFFKMLWTWFFTVALLI